VYSYHDYVSVDELYVVSDLHIATDTTRSLFDSFDEFCGLLAYLSQRARDRRLGLVINGDFIDFLAAPGAKAFDPPRAIRTLLDLNKSGCASEPLFRSIREFLQGEHARLFVLIGNHDIELGLPDVGQLFADILALPSDNAKLHLIMDGTPFRATVGGRRVVCVHGNEVDPFNAVDLAQLRRHAADAAMGRSGSPHEANAGTKLVVEVLNEAKSIGYPFVDLLKPEDRAVPVVLAALQTIRPDPRLAALVAKARGILPRLAWDSARMGAGWLGYDDAVDRIVAENEPLSDDDAYTLVEALHARGVRAASLAYGHSDLSSRQPRDIDAARTTAVALFLRWATAGGTFDTASGDPTSRAIIKRTGDSIFAVFTGHTHLERCLPFGENRIYVNTGTWARLIELDKASLVESAVSDLLQALAAPTLEDLDKSTFAGAPLVTRRRTVGWVIHDRCGKVVHAGASRVTGTNGLSPSQLIPAITVAEVQS
jgi:hypothetical protein